MTRQKIVVEEGYRTEDVNGAIVTSMGLVESEKGGLRGFIDFDDGKGMATYNITMKGEVAGTDAEDGTRHIPGFLDFGKVNRSLLALGYEPYVDFETKEWGTEPPIVGQPVWIKCVKTSTGTDGKEYKSHIEVIKIGAEESGKPVVKQGTPKPTGKTAQPAAKGALTPELKEAWKEALGKVLTEPLNEIGINTAVKKAYPDEATGKNAAFRKSLADVRVKALAELVKENFLDMDGDAKYSIAA